MRIIPLNKANNQIPVKNWIAVPSISLSLWPKHFQGQRTQNYHNRSDTEQNHPLLSLPEWAGLSSSLNCKNEEVVVSMRNVRCFQLKDAFRERILFLGDHYYISQTNVSMSGTPWIIFPYYKNYLELPHHKDLHIWKWLELGFFWPCEIKDHCCKKEIITITTTHWVLTRLDPHAWIHFTFRKALWGVFCFNDRPCFGHYAFHPKV